MRLMLYVAAILAMSPFVLMFAILAKVMRQRKRVKRGLRSYDPKNVRITFNGVEIQGFADGDFDSNDPGVDVDGPPNEGGSITVTLIQEGKPDAEG